jgi:hypothetical protein
MAKSSTSTARQCALKSVVVAELISWRTAGVVGLARALRSAVATLGALRHISLARTCGSANKGARQDLDALLAKTNIEEMKKMFAFLQALHEALRELHRRHRARLAELFREGLAVAAAEGRGMVLARRSQDDDHSARRQAAWWGRNGHSWPQD